MSPPTSAQKGSRLLTGDLLDVEKMTGERSGWFREQARFRRTDSPSASSGREPRSLAGGLLDVEKTSGQRSSSIRENLDLRRDSLRVP
jgi:hypothetical protein